MRALGRLLVVAGVGALVLAGCGDSDDATESGQGGDGSGQPTVVVTTNLLGDVVQMCFGDQVDVVTIMPVGADPHDFQASAQQANEMREADALIVNGEGFEEGMVDVIEAATADATPTYEAISAVETIEFGEGGHDEHSDEEHADEKDSDEEHADEEGHDHDHEGADPHFWTDPARVVVSVDGMTAFLVENVDGINAEELQSSADECVAELEELDAEVEATLVAIPDGRRVMVTDHDSFGYFAERYGFEVVGTVIPSGSTTDGASAGALAELAEVIEAEGVPAIFVGTTVSDDLTQTLAAEVDGDVEVVELYTGSLGEPDSEAGTYVGMVSTNATLMAEALG